jgi:hypothetical protein
VLCENAIAASSGFTLVDLKETAEALSTRARTRTYHRCRGCDEFVAQALVRTFFMILLSDEPPIPPQNRVRGDGAGDGCQAAPAKHVTFDGQTSSLVVGQA